MDFGPYTGLEGIPLKEAEQRQDWVTFNPAEEITYVVSEMQPHGATQLQAGVCRPEEVVG